MNNSNTRNVPSPHPETCDCLHCYEEARAEKHARDYVKQINKDFKPSKWHFLEQNNKKFNRYQGLRCHGCPNPGDLGCAAISSDHKVNKKFLNLIYLNRLIITVLDE